MALVLVTGAAGFVGRALCAQLLRDGHRVRAVARRPAQAVALAALGAEPLALGELTPHTDWRAALAGVDGVVHLAALVHQMQATTADQARYQAQNVETSRALAQAAVGRAGRMIFLSTVKVHGEQTQPHAPFRETDAPCPHGPYASSKWAAEQALGQAADQGLELVVLRPPLIYGPGVGANFRRLLTLVDRGLPLPLGLVRNQRSYLFLGNLVSAMSLCLQHPAAAGRTYLVGDGHDLSTPELIDRLAQAMGRTRRLWPLPPPMLNLAGRALGRQAEIQRLACSLTLDPGLLRRELGWNPPHSLDDGLAQTVAWYRGLPRGR